MEEKATNSWTTAILLIFLAATLNSLSQVIWKFASAADAKGILLLILGLLVSGAGLVFMMIAFRFGEVSILQPMMSLGFAFSIFFGNFFFGETITMTKVTGTLIIILGVVLLNSEGKKGGER